MFRLLKLNNVAILDQLRLEEALLRASSENWCLINTGSPPAIVMGISGKPEKLLNIQKVTHDKICVIKRFSGGGTVYIDSQTIFVTFICNSSTFNFPLQPKPILQWSETLYKPLFKEFSLRENDYVFGERKFGGNAQYIQKSRWLLHSSFLWDYTPQNMEYLLLPEKRPHYRGTRSHADFLCTLRPYFPHKEELMDKLAQHIQKTLPGTITSLEEAEEILKRPHRSATLNISASLEELFQNS
jgi:lipoate---protein ligase